MQSLSLIPIIINMQTSQEIIRRIVITMKIIISLGVAFVVLLHLGKAEDNKYTTKYDNIDIDQILKSERLLKNYVNCLLEKGNCSPDGLELKRVLPDALHTDCSKCSETQKNGSKKIVRHLIDNRKDWWNDLEAKFDKNGDYRKKYEAEVKESRK